MSARRALTVARVERRKLLAQVPLRLLVVVSVLGPVLFGLLLRVQRGAPADALLGAWVRSSGYAVSLVVLSFAANWGFPLVAGVLAGDLLSAEDRQGTWGTLLTRSRTLGELFAGKVLAAAGFALLLGGLLAVVSLVAGLAVVGHERLVDLSGHALGPGRLLPVVLLSWGLCLAPLLAYTSLGVLFSVASRNGIVGVLGPVLVSLVCQLLALVGKGVVVHQLLIGSAFDAWHGLLTTPVRVAPVLVALLVCGLWTAASLGAAWAILRRREFVAAGGATRSGWRTPLRIASAGTLLLALLALASSWGPVGVDAPRLAASMGPEFRRLTLLQQELLGHPIPAGSRYSIKPLCSQRGGTGQGPGDWSCTMNVYIVLAGARQPLTNTPVSYEVTVQSNGCYKASAPPAYVGQADLRDRRGRLVVNPLVTIYGCVDVL